MGAIASQITSLTIVNSTVIQRQIKENTKAPRHWPLCGEFNGDRWIHRGPMNSPHKWPVTRKMFPFDDVIMNLWSVWREVINWNHNQIGWSVYFRVSKRDVFVRSKSKVIWKKKKKKKQGKTLRVKNLRTIRTLYGGRNWIIWRSNRRNAFQANVIFFSCISIHFMHLFYNMYEMYESIYVEIMIVPRVKQRPILFWKK